MRSQALDYQDEILETFGKRVRSLRQAKSLSQEDLAEIVSLDRTYISDVELGKRNISLINIANLARGLEVKIASLFNE